MPGGTEGSQVTAKAICSLMQWGLPHPPSTCFLANLLAHPGVTCQLDTCTGIPVFVSGKPDPREHVKCVIEKHLIN